MTTPKEMFEALAARCPHAEAKWISVKDRLPEDRQEVLTYWPMRDQIQVQRYYYEYTSAEDGPWFMFGWQNHLLSEGRITHWMPLPDPPKGDGCNIGNRTI